ncbi:MAG: nucleotidyl transferase AbiEii/AbiGii toxin family protein [Clostridia bacterium]|jgi:predicted nucleotidyltransferase component of viral defense system|nr:nucleotidyl transferase AbiEii/AbiGii toxin family protein [Clostridia bacterium]
MIDKAKSTIDIDFLIKNQSIELEKIEKVIKEIIGTKTNNDFIKFNIKGFSEINAQKEYPGLAVNMIAEIGNTKTPINIDLGVGDVIVPKEEVRNVKTQLNDFEEINIKTYSIESVIAEKFDAILQRFEATSRMKDFYDIWYLANMFEFSKKQLNKAITETIKNRNTVCSENYMNRIEQMSNNQIILRRWKSFASKNDIEIEFSDAVNLIKKFIELNDNEGKDTIWNHRTQEWES